MPVAAGASDFLLSSAFFWQKQLIPGQCSRSLNIKGEATGYPDIQFTINCKVEIFPVV